MNVAIYFAAIAVLIGVFYYLLDLRYRALEARVGEARRTEIHTEEVVQRLDERVRELTRLASELEEHVVERVAAEAQASKDVLQESVRRILEHLQREGERIDELASQRAEESPGDPTAAPVDLNPLSEQLSALRDELSARVASLEQKLEGTRQRLLHEWQEFAKGAADLDEPQAEDAERELARQLAGEGFESVTLLGRVASQPCDGAQRFVVEAVRSGVSYKGQVTIEAGTITARDLRPAYAMFP